MNTSDSVYIVLLASMSKTLLFSGENPRGIVESSPDETATGYHNV